MDALILRTVFLGDDSDLIAVEARADARIDAFISKKRDNIKIGLEVPGIGKIKSLDAALESLQKRADVKSKVRVDTEGEVEKVTTLGRAMGNITDKSATVRVNTGDDLQRIEAIQKAIADVQSKTVNLGVSGGGGASGGGGGASGAHSSPSAFANRLDKLQTSGFHQMAAGAIIDSTLVHPLLGLGEKFIDQSAAFEKQMNMVGALTNVGTQNVARYRREILGLTTDPLISKGPKELADAFFLAGSKNRDAVTAFEALKAAAHGATAGLGEVKEVEGGVTSVLNAFSLGADKSSHLMDVFTNTVRQGGVEANGFVSALPKVASTAAAVGLSVEEMSASIATMTRVGIPAGTAATSLNRLLMSIIKPSQQAREAFKDLGITVEDVLANLHSKGLQATLADLFKRAGNDVTKLAPVLGSMNSIRAALTTQGSQPGEYQRIVQSYSHIDGLTDRAAENATHGLAVQLEALRSAAEVTGIELGDRLSPRLAPLVRFLRETLPDAAKMSIGAWDSLDPTAKKAAASLLALLALSGPILLFTGTLKVLAAALAQGALGIMGLATAGPLGLAALAALALAAGLTAQKLGDLYEETLNLKEAQDAAAASTSAMVKQLDAAAKVSSSSPAAKSGIGRLSKELTEAGDNTSKLLQVLKEAHSQKVELGHDMKLSPLGKAVAERELQQFINNLSARVITLDVKLTGAVDTANGKVTPATIADSVAASGAAEDAKRAGNGGSWADRAKAAGITQTEPHQKGPDDLSYYTDYQEWQNKIIAAEQKRAGAQSASNTATAQAVPLTKAQTAALHEQREAVGKLTDAQLKHERDRLTGMAKAGKLTMGATGYDAEASTRAEKVENEYNRRQQVAHQKRAAALAEQQRLAKEAAEAQSKAAAETSERLLQIEEKRIGQLETLWNGFGNTVESILSSIHRAGDDDKNVRQLAAQATLAKREFAGIPPELKATVIGIAAIGDAMDKLTGRRDKLRGFFGQMFKDALQSGGDTGAVAQMAALYERRLDYTRRMNDYNSRINHDAGTVVNTVEGWREGLSQRREQISEARRMTGRGFDSAVYVDADDTNARAHVGNKTFGGVKPFVADSGNRMGARFGFSDIGGVGSRPNESDHPGGLALDYMVHGNSQKGSALAAYLVANAKAENVKYVIWEQKIWSAARSAEGWRSMPDRGGPTANHMDHVHVSYNARSSGTSRAAAIPTGVGNSKGAAISSAARMLGIDPVDLATIISYETGGSFSPSVMGGKGGNYMGLIQFGPSERRKYGLDRNQSFEEQMIKGVVPFLRDRFAGVRRSTEGATLLDLYKTVNGGNPGVSAGASDGNGTIAQHVARMQREHRAKAEAIVGRALSVPLPDDSEAMRRLAATPTVVPVKTARAYTAPPAPKFFGELLEYGLPKGFGGAVTNRGMLPGEVRDNQRAAQELVLNQRELQKLVDELNKGAGEKALREGNLLRFKPLTADSVAGELRRFTRGRDQDTSVENVTDAAKTSIRDMGRQIRLLGHENNPYLVLLEEFNTGADRLLDGHGRASKIQMTLGLMVESTRRETREARAVMQREVLSLRAVSGLLSDPNNAGSTYDRALFADKTRRDIWAPDTKVSQLLETSNALRRQGEIMAATGRYMDADNLRQRANAIAKEANAQATQRLTNAMLEYDNQQSAAALRQNALDARGRGDALSMQNYSNDLLNEGFRGPDVDQMAEVEAARRKTLRDLEPATVQDNRPASFLRRRADGKTTQAGANLRAEWTAQDAVNAQDATGIGASRRDKTTLDDAHTSAMALLRTQIQLTGQYRSGSRELDLQLQVARKRSELEAANRAKPTPQQRTSDAIQKELDGYEEELRKQVELARLQEQKSNALSAQNSLLDLQKEAELSMVQTARERLEIEFRYEDLRRKKRGDLPASPEELEARRGQIEQAGKNERMGQMRSVAGDTQRIMSDAVETGLRDGSAKGVRSLLQNLKSAMMHDFAESVSARFTNKLFRGRMGGADAIPHREPGLWDVIAGRDKKPRGGSKRTPLAVPLLRSAGDLTSRFALAPHKSGGLAHLMAYAHGAHGAQAGKGGGSHKNVVIHASKAQVDIAHGEVRMGGGVKAGAASGAGSSPSADQFLGAMGEFGSFASQIAGVGGLFKH